MEWAEMESITFCFLILFLFSGQKCSQYVPEKGAFGVNLQSCSSLHPLSQFVCFQHKHCIRKSRLFIHSFLLFSFSLIKMRRSDCELRDNMPKPIPCSPKCFRLLSQSSSEIAFQKTLNFRGYIKDRYEV